MITESRNTNTIGACSNQNENKCTVKWSWPTFCSTVESST